MKILICESVAGIISMEHYSFDTVSTRISLLKNYIFPSLLFSLYGGVFISFLFKYAPVDNLSG